MPNETIAQKNQKIFKSIEDQNLNAVKTSIENDVVDIETKNKTYETPLIYAFTFLQFELPEGETHEKTIEIIDYLIEKGADRGYGENNEATSKTIELFRRALENDEQPRLILGHDIDFSNIIKDDNIDNQFNNLSSVLQKLGYKNAKDDFQKLYESFQEKHKDSDKALVAGINEAFFAGNEEIIDYFLSDSCVTSKKKDKLCDDILQLSEAPMSPDQHTLACFQMLVKASESCKDALCHLREIDNNEDNEQYPDYTLDALTNLFIKFGKKGVSQSFEHNIKALVDIKILNLLEALEVSNELLSFSNNLENSVASNSFKDVQHSFEMLPKHLQSKQKIKILDINEEHGMVFLERVLNETCDRILPNPQIVAELLKNGANPLTQ